MSTLPTRATSSRRAFVAGGLATSLLGAGALPVGAQRPPPSRKATPGTTQPSSISDLLGLYPARWSNLAQLGPGPLEVVNMAAALAPHGIAPLTAEDIASGAQAIEGYPRVLKKGGIDSQIFQEIREIPDIWQETFAVNPHAVHALLNHRFREDSCTILRAGFDRDQVHAAWTALGYVPIPGADGIMRLDMESSPRLDYLLLGLNGMMGTTYDYATIVADDVIAFGSHQEYVERAWSLTPGAAGSMLTNRSVAACADMLPSDTALLSLLSGGLFWADPLAEPLMPQVVGISTTQENFDRLTARLEREGALLEQLDAEHGRMPILELVGLARSAGSEEPGSASDGQEMLLIRPLNPKSAASAMEIVSRRFEQLHSLFKNRPYLELFRIADITVSESGVGMMALDPLADISLLGLFYAGDLRFLNYG